MASEKVNLFSEPQKTTNTQTKSAPSAHVLSYYNFWWGRALPKRLKTNQRHLFSGRVESNKTDSFFRAHFGNIIRICKGTAEPKMSHVSVISVFYEQTNERKKESRLPFEYKCWCECCIGIYFGLRRLTVLEALRRNMYFLSSNEAVAAKPKEIRSEKIEISKIIFRLPAQMVLRIYRNALSMQNAPSTSDYFTSNFISNECRIESNSICRLNNANCGKCNTSTVSQLIEYSNVQTCNFAFTFDSNDDGVCSWTENCFFFSLLFCNWKPFRMMTSILLQQLLSLHT